MDQGEDAEVAARREFMRRPASLSRDCLMRSAKFASVAGKRVIAFAVEGDVDVQTIQSNTFEIEWRRRVVGCRVFLKSIAPNGSTCPRPVQRFLKASDRF